MSLLIHVTILTYLALVEMQKSSHHSHTNTIASLLTSHTITLQNGASTQWHTLHSTEIFASSLHTTVPPRFVVFILLPSFIPTRTLRGHISLNSNPFISLSIISNWAR
ncbi:hypothetical protein BLNAU_8932 [Blattamonas nauphoetae]|uniref:Secreted protein n=1 Tax=Blattamonas nauphoetae TaxID=2049346 RepID=A0ABQ9XXH0_9EUKA|nr:hypothetical protein BLNAU_8932 [Blattamonas nauphoetae]